MLLVLGHVLAIGASRWPAAPARGDAVKGGTFAAVPRRTLRVATFNIHSGRNTDGEWNLDRTAECLRDFDLVALNEVQSSGLWDRRDQAEQLGQSLSVGWLFAPCERRFGHDSFGNGLLCSLPIRRWETLPLPSTQEYGFRTMLLAQVEFCGVTLHVLITHVDRRRDREPQLCQVLKRFLALPPPTILLGDLNSTAEDVELQAGLACPGVVDALHNVAAPNRHIDWILTRGLQSVSAGCIDKGVSDHPLYWAELELPSVAEE